MVRETATLTREDRLQVDAELASRLEGAGDRMVAALARKLTYRLDPSAALRRSQKAENDRRVTIRPAPDTMSNVTGLLPVAQGVAVYAALRQHAKALRAQGDPRTISQIMADTFYTRLTGHERHLWRRDPARHERAHPAPRRPRTRVCPGLRHHPRLSGTPDRAPTPIATGFAASTPLLPPASSLAWTAGVAPSAASSAT